MFLNVVYDISEPNPSVGITQSELESRATDTCSALSGLIRPKTIVDQTPCSRPRFSQKRLRLAYPCPNIAWLGSLKLSLSLAAFLIESTRVIVPEHVWTYSEKAKRQEQTSQGYFSCHVPTSGTLFFTTTPDHSFHESSWLNEFDSEQRQSTPTIGSSANFSLGSRLSENPAQRLRKRRPA